MQTINLDISKRGVVPLLYAKQGDVGCKFKAVITDEGSDYPIPTGAVVSVWYSGASGEGNYTDIGADSAISVASNVITVEMITQMLSNPGAGVICLVLNTKDGDQKGLWNIPYVVESLPGAKSAAAKEYYTAFSKSVSDLRKASEWVKGFGLGGAQQIAFADLDKVRAPGWYYINGDLVLWNDNWRYAYLRVDAFAAGSKYATQTLYIVSSSHTTLQRFFYGTNAEGFAWSAWEHVRPNMSVGVEYLTTELYNGYHVYSRIINCGILAGGDNSIIYSSTAVYPIRYAITVGTSCSYSNYGVIVDGTAIKINNPSSTNLALGNAFVQVWYTKEYDEVDGFYFTKQPEGATISLGESLVLTVEVHHSDPASLTYQWKFANSYYPTAGWNNTSADGGTTASATVKPSVAGVKYYRCDVTDTDGNIIISNAAKVEVV